MTAKVVTTVTSTAPINLSLALLPTEFIRSVTFKSSSSGLSLLSELNVVLQSIVAVASHNLDMSYVILSTDTFIVEHYFYRLYNSTVIQYSVLKL